MKTFISFCFAVLMTIPSIAACPFKTTNPQIADIQSNLQSALSSLGEQNAACRNNVDAAINKLNNQNLAQFTREPGYYEVQEINRQMILASPAELETLLARRATLERQMESREIRQNDQNVLESQQNVLNALKDLTNEAGTGDCKNVPNVPEQILSAGLGLVTLASPGLSGGSLLVQQGVDMLGSIGRMFTRMGPNATDNLVNLETMDSYMCTYYEQVSMQCQLDSQSRAPEVLANLRTLQDQTSGSNAPFFTALRRAQSNMDAATNKLVTLAAGMTAVSATGEVASGARRAALHRAARDLQPDMTALLNLRGSLESLSATSESSLTDGMGGVLRNQREYLIEARNLVTHAIRCIENVDANFSDCTAYQNALRLQITPESSRANSPAPSLTSRVPTSPADAGGPPVDNAQSSGKGEASDVSNEESALNPPVQAAPVAAAPAAARGSSTTVLSETNIRALVDRSLRQVITNVQAGFAGNQNARANLYATPFPDRPVEASAYERYLAIGNSMNQLSRMQPAEEEDLAKLRQYRREFERSSDIESVLKRGLAANADERGRRAQMCALLRFPVASDASDRYRRVGCRDDELPARFRNGTNRTGPCAYYNYIVQETARDRACAPNRQARFPIEPAPTCDRPVAPVLTAPASTPARN